MKPYLNRFIYFINIASPILGCGLIVSGLAINNFSFLIAGGLNIILFYVTAEMGYRIFEFESIDRAFGWMNLPPLTMEEQEIYNDIDIIICAIEKNWNNLDIYERISIRKDLRRLLAKNQVVAELFEDRMKSAEINL